MSLHHLVIVLEAARLLDRTLCERLVDPIIHLMRKVCMSDNSRVIVANAGAIPELPWLAAGLHKAGMLAEYRAPFANRGSVTRYQPKVLAIQMRRRQVPEALESARICSRATSLEALTVLSQRLPLSAARVVTPRLIAVRNGGFDRACARRVRRRRNAVVASYTAAIRTLQSAASSGVISFLDCPTAHPDHLATLLSDEADRVPSLADSLQAQIPGVAKHQALREEIQTADYILCLSSYQRATFIESGVEPSKLLLTSLGVDTTLFKPRPTVPRKCFTVLFVGQITQRKGLSYLLEAVESLPFNVKLKLVGRPVGKTRDVFDHPLVEHVPHVPRWQLPDIYASADAFVLPSLVEGFPMTALEAMASGIPTIVSRHTFADDIITDGSDGFIVPIRSSEAIQNCLVALHRDRELAQRVGRAGAARAGQFSWEAYGAKAASLIESKLLLQV